MVHRFDGRGLVAALPMAARRIVFNFDCKGKEMTSSNQRNNQDNQNQGQKQTQGSGRGFASMDPQRQREIASAGGRAAHEKGTAHEFTSEEAREAGRKGGENSHGGRGSASSGSNN